MSVMMSAVAAVIGVVCAGTGIVVERRRRQRAGLPTDLRAVVGFEPGAMRAGSLERALFTDAAALSFVFGFVALNVYGFVAAIADLPNPSAPVLCGLAGMMFGSTCALLMRRRNWA